MGRSCGQSYKAERSVSCDMQVIIGVIMMRLRRASL